MKSATIQPRNLNERQRDFTLIFLLSYPFFLFAVLAERVFFNRSSSAAQIVPQRRSVFAEASATAYRTLPYAF